MSEITINYNSGGCSVRSYTYDIFLFFCLFSRQLCPGYAERNNTIERTDSNGIHRSGTSPRKRMHYTAIAVLGHRSLIYITRHVNPAIVAHVSYFGSRAAGRFFTRSNRCFRKEENLDDKIGHFLT